jgi:hypothetical protein
MFDFLTKLKETFIDINTSMKDEQIRKRLFILECRTNLSILAMMDWKVNNKIKHCLSLVPELNCEMSQLLLMHYENEFINNISMKFIDTSDEDGISTHDEPKNKLIQIISKIKALQVIAKQADNIEFDNQVKIELRINNLRITLIDILKEIK